MNIRETAGKPMRSWTDTSQQIQTNIAQLEKYDAIHYITSPGVAERTREGKKNDDINRTRQLEIPTIRVAIGVIIGASNRSNNRGSIRGSS